MMEDLRTQYIAYMEDLAKRHVAIQHTDGARRFFLELDYEKLMGDHVMDPDTWNMVVMGYETSMDDNSHGRRVERITCIFDVLKHVPQGETELLNATYNEARIIGEEVLAKMEWEQKNPCDAEVGAGIIITYSVRMGSKRTVEVGPRWDHFYGYRFSVDLLQETPFRPEPEVERWITPTP